MYLQNKIKRFELDFRESIDKDFLEWANMVVDQRSRKEYSSVKIITDQQFEWPCPKRFILEEKDGVEQSIKMALTHGQKRSMLL